MIKAVFFDLDDTLLNNKNGTYIANYLNCVESYFSGIHNKSGMKQTLIDTIGIMAYPPHYDTSNTQIALDWIVEQGWGNMETVQAAFNEFYQDSFPKLAQHTYAVHKAPEVIEYLLNQDIAVVITTNPVYPTTAIHQRLGWAGLGNYINEFAFITTGDNMHFIKPDPRYYAEVLARISVEPDEVIMVGNDLTNDIYPAEQLAIHTFHITKDTNTPAEATGSISALLNKFEDGWHETLQPRPLQPEMIAPELDGNLGAMFGLLQQVQPHQWTQQPIAGEWSILQNILHLRDRESLIQRPRLKQIANEYNPFLSIPAQDHPRNIGEAEDGIKIAWDFVQERQKTLEFINTLTPEDWQRPARHSIFSNTTLLEMAHFTAQHDRMHMRQICQTLGRCD